MNIKTSKYRRHIDAPYALVMAYQRGNFEKFSKLIDSGANINCVDVLGYPLISCVIDNFDKIKNNRKFFDKLLSAGVSLDGNEKVFNMLLSSIIRQNDIYYMEKILEMGGNVNGTYFFSDDGHITYYGPPIFEAMCKFDLSKIELLLKYNPHLELCNSDGQPVLSALFEISMNNNDFLKKCLAILIENQAPVDDFDNCGNRTINYWAKYSGDLEALKLLIKCNVDINVRDSYGYTPLMRCIKNNDIESSVVLIKNGANLNIKNFDGKTAVQLAADLHKFDILNFIESKYDIYRLDDSGKNIGHHILNSSLWNYDGRNIDDCAKFLKDHPDLFSSKNKDDANIIKALKNNSVKRYLRDLNSTSKENNFVK